MARPQGFQRFIIKQGFHGLLLIVGEDQAVRIVMSGNPVARMAQLRKSEARPIHLHRLWWLAGLPVAKRIVASFKDRFASRQLERSWFELPPSEAEQFVEDHIRAMGTWGVPEAAVIDFMRHCERREFC